MTPARSRAAVYFCFAASGAAALVYQVIWARWLGKIFGVTTPSISVVLASFMFGLALGSFVIGRRLARVRDPLALYAWLEVGVGLVALAFPWLTRGVEALYVALVTDATPPLATLAVRLVLSFVLLGLPTTLMGATLPLLTDFLRRSPRHSGRWDAGFLYAANTIGAALGTIVASFVLIELLGVRGTTLVAAGLNFLAAMLARAYARRTSVAAPAPLLVLESARSGRLAIAVLATSGATALASEVLWTRLLETMVGNSTYVFAIILLVYLTGIALGSWLASIVLVRLRSPVLWLLGTQAGMGLCTLVSIVAIVWIRDGLRRFELQPVGAADSLWIWLEAALVLLPGAVLSGAAFPLASRVLDPAVEDAEGPHIARAYAWNTAGAVLGSLVGGFVLAPLFDFLGALYVLAALYAATALVGLGCVARARETTASRRAIAVGLLFAASVLGLSMRGVMRGSDLADRMRDNRSYVLAYHRPGFQAVTTVMLPREGAPPAAEPTLLINGNGMTRKVTATKVMAHLPLLSHPSPQNTLVICFGMGTTYRSALTHGGRVTAVELVPQVLETFDYFHTDAARLRSEPRGRLVVNDGRNFLAVTRQQFDVITIDPPPPIDAAGVNNLYSKDFFELARSRLAPGGIFAHWIPNPESMSGVADQETFDRLVRTFALVFPHVRSVASIPAVGLHLIGSLEPFRVPAAELRAKLARPEIAADLSEWDEIPVNYFFRFHVPRLDRLPVLEPITDDNARLEFDLIRSLRSGVAKTKSPIWW